MATNFPTAINGKNLDEKAFFPIYAKCEELGWPIFTHPVAPLGGERMSKYYLSNLLGNPVEIGMAGYSLILGGVVDAFPKLEVVWLETSAGADQVLLVTRESLLKTPIS